MLFCNPRANRESYPERLKSVMSVEVAHQSREWLSNWDQLSKSPTPLWSLPGIAEKLGVAQFMVKDESTRSPLASFKALGAPIALIRLILRTMPEKSFDPKGLITGQFKADLRDFTVVSATDGNHGRALAAAAQSVGCKCVIVLHANVSVERELAIAAFGADIVRINGNYDESVEYAAQVSKKHGWPVVSDTSYEGYETVPRDVMQGYGTIAEEVLAQTKNSTPGECPFTHVFLQGGVGGMAAGIASYLWEVYQDKRPTFVIVEPQQADCLFQSAVNGLASRATGSVDSVMAGLACGETSPLAWRFLENSIDFFQTISDENAISAMQLLAKGGPTDIPVIAGESGVAGLAALQLLAMAPHEAKTLGLNGESKVLIINTEGATAPSVYSALVGEASESVLARQQDWHRYRSLYFPN
ncbi:diaminopropionate ammonia-lyase [Pseudomonas syringae]|uniref:diaminopropionate ammonia-lyase n=1 Tax=Pseudomonas syringae TaxID=317 RepID=UPI00089C5830|nr:diaminopropionate ammonia-lyase [Pseudomonas syringae]SDX76030.1 diaminopropionate ammonia-lyase [Pseudomonas syringae]SFM82972.1 diaminopropionate ammonia-lyase [Pseudomonas syringae]